MVGSDVPALVTGDEKCAKRRIVMASALGIVDKAFTWIANRVHVEALHRYGLGQATLLRPAIAFG